MNEEQLRALLVNIGIHIGWGAWHDHQDWFEMDVYARASVEDIAWLSEQDGPITDVAMLLARSAYFALDSTQALAVLGEVHAAVRQWRQLAQAPEVGLQARELDDFAPAFEHPQMDAAASLL